MTTQGAPHDLIDFRLCSVLRMGHEVITSVVVLPLDGGAADVETLSPGEYVRIGCTSDMTVDGVLRQVLVGFGLARPAHMPQLDADTMLAALRQYIGVLSAIHMRAVVVFEDVQLVNTDTLDRLTTLIASAPAAPARAAMLPFTSTPDAGTMRTAMSRLVRLPPPLSAAALACLLLVSLLALVFPLARSRGDIAALAVATSGTTRDAAASELIETLAASEGFVVEVGTQASRETAAAAVDALIRAGRPAFPEAGAHPRVLIGPFATRHEAETEQAAVRPLFPQAKIVVTH